MQGILGFWNLSSSLTRTNEKTRNSFECSVRGGRELGESPHRLFHTSHSSLFIHLFAGVTQAGHSRSPPLFLLFFFLITSPFKTCQAGSRKFFIYTQLYDACRNEEEEEMAKIWILFFMNVGFMSTKIFILEEKDVLPRIDCGLLSWVCEYTVIYDNAIKSDFNISLNLNDTNHMIHHRNYYYVL